MKIYVPPFSQTFTIGGPEYNDLIYVLQTGVPSSGMIAVADRRGIATSPYYVHDQEIILTVRKPVDWSYL